MCKAGRCSGRGGTRSSPRRRSTAITTRCAASARDGTSTSATSRRLSRWRSRATSSRARSFAPTRRATRPTGRTSSSCTTWRLTRWRSTTWRATRPRAQWKRSWTRRSGTGCKRPTTRCFSGRCSRHGTVRPCWGGRIETSPRPDRVALSRTAVVAIGLTFLVIGLGFGALVLGLNQLVAYSEGRRRAALLSALNSAYSAGAVAGPVLVVVFARDHFSLFFLAAAAVALALIPGAVGILGRLPTASGSPSRPGLLVFVFIVAFTLYVGVETGTGGWMPSHLESAGLRSQDAATATSGFFLAIVTGRLLMTLMPARVPEHAIVIAGAGLGAVALLAASIGPLAPWAYIAAGLALAPIFPTGIVWLAKLRAGDSRATSWLFPAASVGGIVGPGAIGLVIAGFGVGWTPVVLALVGAGMSAAFWSATRLR